MSQIRETSLNGRLIIKYSCRCCNIPFQIKEISNIDDEKIEKFKNIFIKNMSLECNIEFISANDIDTIVDNHNQIYPERPLVFDQNITPMNYSNDATEESIIPDFYSSFRGSMHRYSL